MLSACDGTLSQSRSRTPSVRISEVAQQWGETQSTSGLTVLEEAIENSKNDVWDKRKEKVVSAVKDFQKLVSKCGVKHKVQSRNVTPTVVGDFVKSKRLQGTELWLSKSMEEILAKEGNKLVNWECAGAICASSHKVRDFMENAVISLSHNLPIATTEDRRNVTSLFDNWSKERCFNAHVINQVRQKYLESCQWSVPVDPPPACDPPARKKAKEQRGAQEPQGGVPKPSVVSTDLSAAGYRYSDSRIKRQLAGYVGPRFIQETGTLAKGGTPARRAKREKQKLKKEGKREPEAKRTSGAVRGAVNLPIDLDVSDDAMSDTEEGADVDALLGESLQILTNSMANDPSEVANAMLHDNSDDEDYGRVTLAANKVDPEFELDTVDTPGMGTVDTPGPDTPEQPVEPTVETEEQEANEQAILHAFFDDSEDDTPAQEEAAVEEAAAPSTPVQAPAAAAPQTPPSQPSPALSRSQSNISYSMVDELLQDEVDFFSLPPRSSVPRESAYDNTKLVPLSAGRGSQGAGQLDIDVNSHRKRSLPDNDLKVHLQSIKKAKRDKKDLVDLTKSRFDIRTFTESDYIGGVVDRQSKEVEVVIVDEKEESIRQERKRKADAKIRSSISSAIAYQSSLGPSLPPPLPLDSLESETSMPPSQEASQAPLRIPLPQSLLSQSQGGKLTKLKCVICSRVYKTTSGRVKCPECRKKQQRS